MSGVSINVKEDKDGTEVQPASETKHPWFGRMVRFVEDIKAGDTE